MRESVACFPRIFERMAPFVWRALRHLGVRRADLPDVCQEVFIVVHRRLPDFDTAKSSLSTWIYGICMRTASQYRRRSPHFREVSELDAREEWVGADQEDAYERGRVREWLELALEQVSDEERAIFVLYELEELPMKEVAAAIGCPIQTAYSRLHRARSRVEKAFKAIAKEKLPT